MAAAAAIFVIPEMDRQSGIEAPNLGHIDSQPIEPDFSLPSSNSPELPRKDPLQQVPHRDTGTLGALGQRYPFDRQTGHFRRQAMNLLQHLFHFRRISTMQLRPVCDATFPAIPGLSAVSVWRGACA